MKLLLIAALIFGNITWSDGTPEADVIILNTRAGLKLFKLFVPGLSGAAQFLPMICFDDLFGIPFYYQ